VYSANRDWNKPPAGHFIQIGGEIGEICSAPTVQPFASLLRLKPALLRIAALLCLRLAHSMLSGIRDN
jgi:hypothetical protein